METTPLGSAGALTPAPPAPLEAPDAGSGGGGAAPPAQPEIPELGLTDDLPAAPPGSRARGGGCWGARATSRA